MNNMDKKLVETLQRHERELAELVNSIKVNREKEAVNSTEINAGMIFKITDPYDSRVYYTVLTQVYTRRFKLLGVSGNRFSDSEWDKGMTVNQVLTDVKREFPDLSIEYTGVNIKSVNIYSCIEAAVNSKL